MGFNKLSHLNSQKSGKEVKRLANFCQLVGGVGWWCLLLSSPSALGLVLCCIMFHLQLLF